MELERARGFKKKEKKMSAAAPEATAPPPEPNHAADATPPESNDSPAISTSRFAQLHQAHQAKLESLAAQRQAPLFDPVTHRPLFKPQINASARAMETRPLYERAMDQERRRQERLKQVQAEEASLRNAPKLSPATPSLAWARLERDLRSAFDVALQYQTPTAARRGSPSSPRAIPIQSTPSFKQSLARQGLVAASSSGTPSPPKAALTAAASAGGVTVATTTSPTAPPAASPRKLNARSVVAFLKIVGLASDTIAQRVMDEAAPLDIDSVLALFRRAYFAPSTPLEHDLALLLPSRRSTAHGSPASLKHSPKPNFRPAITPKSRELDRERTIKLGLDPAEPREQLIMREVHLNKQKREQLGMDVAREAMRECTFAPAVISRPRVAGAVSDRLFSDSQARLQRREEERLHRIREEEEKAHAAAVSASARRLVASSPATKASSPQPRGFEETVARLSKARQAQQLQAGGGAAAKSPAPMRDGRGRLVASPFKFSEPRQMMSGSGAVAMAAFKVRVHDQTFDLVLPALRDAHVTTEVVDAFCAEHDCAEVRSELLDALGVHPSPLPALEAPARLLAEFNVVVSPSRTVRLELYEDDDVDEMCAAFQRRYGVGDEEADMLRTAMRREMHGDVD